MFILIALNILLFLFLDSTLKNYKNKKNIYLFLSIGIVVEFVLLVIYRIDLAALNREVYYSDAETYWKNTLELIRYNYSTGYNSLYYYICYLLQISSPFYWVGWNNLFNITCINFSIAIVIKNLIDLKKDEKNIKIFIILTMCNPFIIYGLMRNLKDALFMFMVFIIFHLMKIFFKTKNNYIKFLIIAIYLFFAYLFIMIRPWGFIVSIIAILYTLFVSFKSKKINIKKTNKIFIICSILIFIVIGYIIYPNMAVTLKVWLPVVKKIFYSRSIIELILGFGKFVLGPGPIRCLFGNKFFVHYVMTGNIMCFIGSIMWWISLIFILSSLVINKKDVIKKLKNNNIMFMILVLIFYVSIYVVQYGGTAEIRLRSVMYIFVYSIFFNICDFEKIKNNKKVYLISSIFLMIVFLGVTFIGL